MRKSDLVVVDSHPSIATLYFVHSGAEASTSDGHINYLAIVKPNSCRIVSHSIVSNFINSINYLGNFSFL